MKLLFFAGAAWALTLEEAQDAAARHSVDLALVGQGQRVAELQVGQAWGTLSPKLSTSANYTINDQEVKLDFTANLPPEMQALIGESEPVVVQQKSYGDANFTVSQPLFNAAALPMLRAAYAMEEAAAADVENAEIKVRNAAAHLYYALIISRESVTILEQALKTATDQENLARRQYEVGTATPLTVKQAEVATVRAERQLAQARQNLSVVEDTFTFLTGLPAGQELSAPTAPEIPFTNLEQALDHAWAHRPDVLAARARVQASQLVFRADTLRWIPTVDARFTGYYTENTGFIDDKTRWMVVGTASWTAWDGGYRLQSNRINSVNMESAELALRRTMELAEAEIRKAWTARHSAEITHDAASRELDLAEEALRLAQLGYEAGTVSFLDVDQSRVGRDFARISALAEQGNLDLASIDLASAVGL